VAYSLFSNLKGLLGPATVPVKSLYSNEGSGGCVIPFILIIRTLIIETVVVSHKGVLSRRVFGCGEGGVVESYPPCWCLINPGSDGFPLSRLIRIVGEIAARMGGISKDALLEGIASVALDPVWA